VEQGACGLTITLARSGQVRRAGAMTPLPVRLSKVLFVPLGQERLVVRYDIKNLGHTRLHTLFATEWNIHLLGGGSNDQAYYRGPGHELENSHFDSTGEVQEVPTFHIGNTWLQQDMGFSLSKAATLWRFSIETVTGSEAGFERTHQGSCLVLLWPIALDAGEHWTVEIVCSGREA